MEGFYTGNTVNDIMALRKKARLSGMPNTSAQERSLVAGNAMSLGANNRADMALEQAKKNAADQLALQRDTLNFNKENATNTLNYNRERDASNTGMQTWLAGQQLAAAQKAQPTSLDKMMQYGGQGMNMLALNNLSGNPLNKFGSAAYNGLEWLGDQSGISGFLFDMFS